MIRHWVAMVPPINVRDWAWEHPLGIGGWPECWLLDGNVERRGGGADSSDWGPRRRTGFLQPDLLANTFLVVGNSFHQRSLSHSSSRSIGSFLLDRAVKSGFTTYLLQDYLIFPQLSLVKTNVLGHQHVKWTNLYIYPCFHSDPPPCYYFFVNF